MQRCWRPRGSKAAKDPLDALHPSAQAEGIGRAQAMGMTDGLREMFGDAVAAIVVSLIGVYADLQKQDRAFEAYPYVTNEAYFQANAPGDLISSLGLPKLAALKYHHDLTHGFGIEGLDPPEIDYRDIERALFRHSIRSIPPVFLDDARPKRATPQDIKRILSDVFDGYPILEFREATFHAEHVFAYDLPMDGVVTWRITVTYDRKRRDFLFQVDLISPGRDAYQVPIDQMFNVKFRANSLDPDEFQNLLGLSLLLWKRVRDHL